ncbi:MAG: ribose 5-phosphate isomerase B [Chitinispirillaceae bacterium]|nr:ribose 5-phosphate isomerase B [Chitinispirillaceae bacterium]
MEKTTIVMGSDHAGWQLKEAIKEQLTGKGYTVDDVSEPSYNAEDDYPVYAARVAKLVSQGRYESGIAVCGTGIGASIAANRIRGARAALCFTPEMGRMAKRHNNANVLVLGGRTTQPADAFMIIESWMNTGFEGGRHSRRVDQLDSLE